MTSQPLGGPTGLWLHELDTVPWSEGRAIAQELESLGYGALWFPEAVGRDALIACTLLLDATERMAAATGIATIYARDAMAMNAAWRTIHAAHPGRFVLGLGVSHAPMVEGIRKTEYAKPLAAMRDYLTRMDEGLFFASNAATPPTRVLAALGPKMLELARDQADGAHPYNVTPDHTKLARDILGDGKLLAVEQKAVLSNDVDAARAAARQHLGVYLGLPNYVNNWKRLGFTDDDVANGGSDRLIDAMVVHGDEATIKARVDEHRAAGADHVCVHVLPTPEQAPMPMDVWRRLAPALV
ncbi:MAG TPA: LLM class F420-dependent oxidoreductase [Acidimicrobiia bacterium]|nr:LLM class F420-dependent oxidoreductase [Acidimicrobiia bacterium]